MTDAFAFIARGGPAMMVIAALSVVTVALIFWKVWRLIRLGAWSGAATRAAVDAWTGGDADAASRLVGRPSLRARVAHRAMTAFADPALSDADAREETERVARNALAEARTGLRALELIATIAPLVGLLGTVLGMIAAFQALQDTGASADPSVLAGGIWEALLTTAAGMAVAIPASMALTWFDGIITRVEIDMEDAATRVFTRAPRGM